MFRLFTVRGIFLGEVNELESGKNQSDAFYIYQGGNLIWQREQVPYWDSSL